MELLKTLHVGCAILSIAGFLLRGVWMLRDSPRLTARATRILPHINDSLLLVTAIALAAGIQQYPFVHAWLTAKVVALLLYIFLGAIALTYGRTRPQRIVAGLTALLVFAYIVAVALTRQPGLGLFTY